MKGAVHDAVFRFQSMAPHKARLLVDMDVSPSSAVWREQAATVRQLAREFGRLMEEVAAEASQRSHDEKARSALVEMDASFFEAIVNEHLACWLDRSAERAAEQYLIAAE